MSFLFDVRINGLTPRTPPSARVEASDHLIGIVGEITRMILVFDLEMTPGGADESSESF